MFSFQIAGNHIKLRLFSNLSSFNKSSNAMISCSKKCSFPMQHFRKDVPLQEQQFRMFRHSCLLQNSPSVASSMTPTLDVDEATATNDEFSREIIQEQQQLEDAVTQTKTTTEPKPIRKKFVESPKIIAEKIYPRLTRERYPIILSRSGVPFI